MRTFNQTVSTDVALNADYTSNAIPLKNIFMFNIAAIVSDTPTGTIKLQVSNDPETNDTIPLVEPPNWVDLLGSSFSLSDEGETMWNVHEVAFNYVRVVYTDTSSGMSDATMTIIFNGKGV